MPSSRLCAALTASVLLVAACGDDDAGSAADLEAACRMMSEISGPEDITVERLDALLEVAPDGLDDAVRVVRDRVEAVGEAAYEEEEVGEAFETVGVFESSECS